MYRLLFGLLLVSAAAQAQITLHNYDGTGRAQVNEINQFDTNRNKVSATDGTLLQLPSGSFGGIPECASSATCFVQYGSYWGGSFRQY